MKAYTFYTFERPTAETFARVAAAYMDRPFDPNATPLDQDRGPYEFAACVFKEEDVDGETLCLTLQRIAKALGMKTEVLHPENPPPK